MNDGAAHSDLTRITAVALAARLRAREVSATEAVEATLASIAAQNGALHAFITVDPGGARQQAQRLDAEAAQGRFAGPLHGVPLSVKDLIATAGLRTTRGSQIYEHDLPVEDDLIVARLRSAGAVLIGKTNTPEFGFGALCANEIAGNTANPYALDRTSGGSSGGAAAAVASGMVPLALGTDFGGSVRTPAAFCNAVGFRPGAGLVPKFPKAALWETMASYGTITRTVADARLMLETMAGHDRRDPASLESRGLAAPFSRTREARVACSLDLGIATIASDVAGVFAEELCRIAAAGFEVLDEHPDFSGAQSAFETLRAAMLFHDFGALLKRAGFVPSPTLRWNVERGRGTTANAWLEAEAARARIYQSCVTFFDRFDFLLLPAASVSPWPLTQPEVTEIDGKPLRHIIDYLTITYAISLVGLPVLSVPGGWTADGLPVGLQIVAGPRREAELLAFAEFLETELGFRHSFPGAPR
jgi:amidase